MSRSAGDLDTLRRAFRARPVEADPEGCPPPDQVWAAARRPRPAANVEAIVDHTARCPACAAAWRLARELGPARVNGRRWTGRWAASVALPLATAAGIVVGVLTVGRSSVWEAAPSDYRRPPESAIVALVERDALLDRSACTLRWRSGLPGARFAVWVTDQELNVLTSPRNLAAEEFTVPAPALEPIRSGEKILWRIEALTADGRRLTSATFVHRLE